MNQSTNNKEPINLQDYIKCIYCGATVQVIGINSMFDNIRIEMTQCPKCKSVFRTHYKVADVAFEVMQNNSQPVPPSQPMQEITNGEGMVESFTDESPASTDIASESDT